VVELQKVILYYGFTPVADPNAVRLWQKTLCEALGIRGRILISHQGINGTLGGDMSALKKYVKRTKEYPGFNQIDFKWSDGTGLDFPRLQVRARAELVGFGNPTEIQVDKTGVIGGGIHLKPAQVNALVQERGSEVVFFDARNAFEAKIGKFQNAIIPEITTTRDFVGEIESGKYDHLKTKPIVAYCTGGIRCEVLTVFMKNRGFKEVYQIEGGIVRYGNKFKNAGLWEGSLYTFDARMAIDFAEDAKVLGSCEICSAATNRFHSCGKANCYELILLCEGCAQVVENKNCTHAQDLARDNEFVG
jgi:UPF0176 protein